MKVSDNAIVEIVLEVNMGELKAILDATKDTSRWPMGSLRSVLRESLDKASTAYFSQHEVEP